MQIPTGEGTCSQFILNYKELTRNFLSDSSLMSVKNSGTSTLMPERKNQIGRRELRKIQGRDTTEALKTNSWIASIWHMWIITATLVHIKNNNNVLWVCFVFELSWNLKHMDRSAASRTNSVLFSNFVVAEVELTCMETKAQGFGWYEQNRENYAATDLITSKITLPTM